ncbi:Pumilio-like 3 [Holothuria leucospilota]|uniref:Pumilio-like 3 n=1 Tax=Holothuria leucospilota TaxID=206669 RepID=A0A9Q1HCV6_HOLLE|nr:Pumilio-like 3 [Holothuria leucospilota]
MSLEKVVQLCKSKFGKHYVIKMLRYGTKEQKHQIMSSFHGKVCQLVRNKDAADVVEESYNNFANAQERSALMEEFYGPRFAVFKEKGVHTLDEILKKSPEMKEGILEHMLKLLPSLLEKSVVKHSIVHKALHDFMVHANNAKRADRKIIIKSFKTFLSKICKEEFGHRVLFALFDCVDDTKLVEKAIINQKTFKFAESSTMKEHHGCKKDKELRQREILEAASKPLLQMVVDNVRELVFDKSRSQLALAILKFASGDKRQAFQAIASLAAEDFVPVFTDSADALTEMHIVEHPSGHLLLKRILQHEKSLTSEETLRFSDVLMEIVPIDCLQKWTTVNRGSLVLLSLYESCSDSNRRSIEESLDAAVLAKRDTKGAKALSEKLKGDGK